MGNSFWKRIGIWSLVMLTCASLLYAARRHQSGGGGGDGGGGFRRTNQGRSSSSRQSSQGIISNRTDARRGKASSMQARRKSHNPNRSQQSSSRRKSSSANRKAKQSKGEQRKRRNKEKTNKTQDLTTKKQKSKSKSKKTRAQKKQANAAKKAQKALSKKRGKTVQASAQTSKVLATRRGATIAALRSNPTARALRTGIAVGVAGGTAGVVVGSSFFARGAFGWRPGATFSFGFWGTPWWFGSSPNCLFFRPFGCWFWPSWRWWYFPWSACWYYPGCWYYPYLGCSIYLTNERKCVYLIENDSDDQIYAAVYYRKPLEDDQGYYLYRVDEPITVTSKTTIKIRAPKRRKKEYIILTDKDKNKLGESIIQDIDGSIIQPEEGDIQTYPKDSRREKINIEKLNKADKKALNKIKEESDLNKAKSELSNKSDALKDFDAEAEIERNKENKDAARNLTEADTQKILEGKLLVSDTSTNQSTPESQQSAAQPAQEEAIEKKNQDDYPDDLLNESALSDEE